MAAVSTPTSLRMPGLRVGPPQLELAPVSGPFNAPRLATVRDRANALAASAPAPAPATPGGRPRTPNSKTVGTAVPRQEYLENQRTSTRSRSAMYGAAAAAGDRARKGAY